MESSANDPEPEAEQTGRAFRIVQANQFTGCRFEII